MNAYRELMRRRLLEQIYDKMSDDEKRLFVQMTMQNKDHNEIMEALQSQKADLEAIKKKQNSLSGYSSDLLANFTSAGILWLGSRLFKNL